MEYKVRITEHLEKDIFVEAETKEEALEEVKRRYHNGEIILDADNYTDTKFEVKK